MPADKAVPAEGYDQVIPCDSRRQYKRKCKEHVEYFFADELFPRQNVSHSHADNNDCQRTKLHFPFPPAGCALGFLGAGAGAAFVPFGAAAGGAFAAVAGAPFVGAEAAVTEVGAGAAPAAASVARTSGVCRLPGIVKATVTTL